jgi:hypothetical protein
MITGKTYLERGQPVTVLAQWNGKGPRAMTYVAPASRVLTDLHIPEPGYEADQAAGATPVTLCGEPIAEAGLWREVERRDGDQLCARCAGEPTREPGLW